MRNREGFTFVELMIVMTIMGLLASIALNRMSGTRDRSFVATMRSDLRNLALAQESYFYDSDIYSSDLSTLEDRGFGVAAGVSLTMNEATVIGWSATASHANTAVRCYVYVGLAAPVGSATREGEISCS
jgi:general secretion pathway protein G